MVTITADVTEEIRKMAMNLVEQGMYKSQSEVIRDAVRQLAYKYSKIRISEKEAREIVRHASQKTKESLGNAVQRIREE